MTQGQIHSGIHMNQPHTKYWKDWLIQEYNVTFVHEIDCSDVSDGEAEREKIVVYRVGEGE